MAAVDDPEESVPSVAAADAEDALAAELLALLALLELCVVPAAAEALEFEGVVIVTAPEEPRSTLTPSCSIIETAAKPRKNSAMVRSTDSTMLMTLMTNVGVCLVEKTPFFFWFEFMTKATMAKMNATGSKPNRAHTRAPMDSPKGTFETGCCMLGAL